MTSAVAPSPSLPAEESTPASVDVLGIRVHALTVATLYEQVSRLLAHVGKHLVTYVNVHTMNVATTDPRLREAYRRSDITYCDGAGVVLGARLLGRTLPERMTSATFIHDFFARWQHQGPRLFFLGGRPGVADEACRRLRQRYPGLELAGAAHGFLAAYPGGEEEVLQMIARARTDVLFVGLGTPLQERWVLDNWERIEARVVWPIGALVDYLSGEVPRAPEWMLDHSMEWLFRLLLEPRRLYQRYMVGIPLFAYRILRERMGHR